MRLTISIVYFDSGFDRLGRTLHSTCRALVRAIEQIPELQAMLVLVDNSGHKAPLELLLNEHCTANICSWKVIDSGGNIGYGAGHNLAQSGLPADYILVLNPDVDLAEDAMTQALSYLQRHPQVGLLSPAVSGPDNTRQYLCKRHPAVLDLLLRGFAPDRVKRLFRRRLDDYQMREIDHQCILEEGAMVSGCFMFLRHPVFTAVNGFAPEFFLYFEDFDLSKRVQQLSRIAYVPKVRIIHGGGDAAKKGSRHIWLFFRSAWTFYNKHGWRWI